MQVVWNRALLPVPGRGGQTLRVYEGERQGSKPKAGGAKLETALPRIAHFSEASCSPCGSDCPIFPVTPARAPARPRRRGGTARRVVRIGLLHRRNLRESPICSHRQPRG